MLRAPSTVKNRDEFFSLDEAFKQLPKGADEAAEREHARQWKVARETGDYHQLLIEGQTPTKFVLKPISAEVLGTLVDMANKRDSQGVRVHGDNEIAALALRVALVSVSNFGDAEVAHGLHAKFGMIASLDFLSVLPTQLAANLISELGWLVLNRARELSPS
jgi:hypothetical protein